MLKGKGLDVNRKIKKIGICIIIAIFISVSFGKLLENSQSNPFNKSEMAISNAFITVLATDTNVKHQNPYFYGKNSFILTAQAIYYGFSSLEVKGKVTIEGTLIKNYENGDLFKAKVNFLESQNIIYENEIPAYLTGDRVIFYFYVTGDKIYRVSPYIYDEEKGQLYVGLNNEWLLTYLLPTDQEIIENSVIVCQDEEIHIVDKHDIVSSVTQKNGKVEYSRREYNQSNSELHFHEEFVWEKGRGLVSYGSAYRVEADIFYLNGIEAAEEEVLVYGQNKGAGF